MLTAPAHAEIQHDMFIISFLHYCIPQSFPCQIISKKSPAVLVIMTIDTKILPIRAVSRVVPVIAVFVMDREEMPVTGVKLSAALGADQAVDFQGLFPVIRG
jgi:hypothetical protein